MAEIPYNVRGVPRRPPFPLKDPELDGTHPSGKEPRPRRELPDKFERFRLFDVEGLGEFPPVEWHIDGYLAVGELTVFYGKGDTYKSFVALDWACELAHQGYVVIYVVSEGASGIKARIAAWQKHRAVAELPTLRLMPANVHLHQPTDVRTWADAMRHQLDADGLANPALVVVDTLARNFVGGSENNPQDMGLFVEGIEQIRRGLETAVLVIHHSTKDDKTERGTESLRNASFAVFHFNRVNATTAVDVKCERMKDAEPPGARRVVPVKVELPELGPGVSSLVAAWADSGRVSGHGDPKRRPETTGPEKELLRALCDPNQDPKRDALARRLKVSTKTVARCLKSLETKGLLIAEGSTRDRRHVLTDSGRNVRM